MRRMQDNSQKEKDFERNNTIRGRFCTPCRENERYYPEYISYGSIIPHAVSLLSSVLIVVGPWALAQCSVFLPVTTQTSVSVIIISVLVTIVGFLMIAAIIGFALAVKYERASTSDKQHLSVLLMPGILLIILAVISITLGVAAGALIPTLSDTIRTSANSSFLSILDSPVVRGAWDAAQDTLQCCGVIGFSDYEQVFGNLFVPVSCCNMTNPLSNEIMCTENGSAINFTDNVIHNAVYSEGCAPKLESLFRYVLSVVAGASISVGILQIIGEAYSISYLVWDGYLGSIVARTYRYFQTAAGLILVLGIAYIAVSIWALVQTSSFYYSITAQANAKVIALSVLLIIVGVVMTGTSICQLVAGRKKIDDDKKTFRKLVIEIGVICVSILPILLVIAVGIAAVVLSQNNFDFGSTLSNYSNDRNVQEAWNSVQENLKCCGAVNFTDYRAIFNSSFSVPVSCCNSTHPLASNCSEIVQQIINQTDLIYSEGCVSQLESFFMNIFSVVGGVSIIFGSIQLIAAILWLFTYGLIFVAAVLDAFRELGDD